MRLSPLPLHRFVRRFSLALLAAVILLYAGLIRLAPWEVDEFTAFVFLRNGLSGIWSRVSWSPRPISEWLFLCYGGAVNHWRTALITPFLGALWALLLAAGLCRYWPNRRKSCAPFLLLLPLTLIALFVTEQNQWEIFYWPAGAVAYLPTLAATLLLLMLLLTPSMESPRKESLAALCLLFAAGCSEAGALLSLLSALFWLLHSAVNRGSGIRRASLLLWSLTALLTLLPLGALGSKRIATTEFAQLGNPQLRSDPVLSALTALAQVGMETLDAAPWNRTAAPPHGAVQFALAHRRPLTLLLAISGIFLCRPILPALNREARTNLNLYGAALLCASWGTAAAALLHFGLICCPRHQSLRNDWILLAAVCFTVSRIAPESEAAHPEPSARELLAPLLLCAAVALNLAPAALAETYRHAAELRQIRERNLASGFDPRSRDMVYLVAPATGLFLQRYPASRPFVVDAAFDASTPTGIYWSYMRRFYGKERILVQPILLAGQEPEAPKQALPPGCASSSCIKLLGP